MPDGIEEEASERAEPHFLAATIEELMRELLSGGALSRDQVQRIEDAVSIRVGSEPYAW